MTSLRSAFLGSGIATFVVTSIMAEQAAMGLEAQFSIARAWAGLIGMPDAAWAGWLAHMLVGTILGGAIFGGIYRKLPGSSAILKGVLFGFASWFLMMVVFMPLAGAGVFALQAGTSVMAFTLALGVIYGVVLGAIYAWDSAPVGAEAQK